MSTTAGRGRSGAGSPRSLLPSRLSLRNRVALLFFAVTFGAIAAMYLLIAPGLQSRLVGDRLAELATAARANSVTIANTVGTSVSESEVRTLVASAAASSGDRVMLLSVAQTPGGFQLSVQEDSSGPNASPLPTLSVASRAVRAGVLRTGLADTVAQAALPITFAGRTAKVVVFSTHVADIVRDVATVRRQILFAGGIALLLALVVGYLVARALTLRVKRLEQAAEKVAGGDFEHPIPVRSQDELGQLAAAFNGMQRQLHQLESARKKFIATASHELRTPIFSLGGFVELLEDEDLDPDTRRRFLEQVREQVDRLRKLSVDLLDLSKLEAGSMELRPEQVDIRELTRSVSGEFEPTLARHDSHLELRLPARAVEAVCDPVRVAQIVRILIDNALTHTPSGTRIVVTAGREDGIVRLAVRDDGEGIESGAMPRIFEPFFTADDVRGSGLGLAIASELAGRMAGQLRVQSVPGDTVFTLEIPA